MEKKEKTKAGELFARKKMLEDCCRRVAGLRHTINEIESVMSAECDAAESEWLAAARTCEHEFAEIENSSHRRMHVCAKCGMREYA